MSKIKSNHIFTSESVSEGHPDKVCDQISDAVLDAYLKSDPESRVACETLATTDLIVISGEITSRAALTEEQIREIARNTVRRIGYNDPSLGFSAGNADIQVHIHRQSPDISQGVTAGQGKYKEQGAGDQGMMFGYASDETPALMPATIFYAHKIMQELAALRHSGKPEYAFLMPDAKSQVSIRYDGGKPREVTTIVVSHQHAAGAAQEKIEELVREVCGKIIPAELVPEKGIRYYVNPTGSFVTGGPHGDTGLTGRKIIVDTYGGVGSHGGGAFSGKDPSKVDRSAAYMCRRIAKNIVAAELARKCEIQVAYAIGVADPLSINIDTYGTGAIPDEELVHAVREVFPLKPAEIISYLNLKHPGAGWCYEDSAAYGHFGRGQFPWENTGDTAALLRAAGR